MNNAIRSLKNQGVLFWSILSIVIVVLLGFIDFLTGYELSLSLFYLAPIAVVSWFVGRRLGLMISVVSAITWFIADFATGHIYLSPFIIAWNTLIRFGFFVIVSLLLDSLRESYQKEQELARTDHTTGIANSRHFYELARMEIDRSRRFGRQFAVAYIDLDNFKAVNDRLGHAQGDEVLRAVSYSAKRLLRSTDLIARLGGDEFAILLTEADEAGSQAAVNKIHTELMAQMRSHDWPVTFSIGAVIFSVPPASVDEMIHMADELMYSVKRDCKGAIRYLRFTG